MSESVVGIVFHRLKIHQNNIFYFFKFIFYISISERFKNI